MCFRSLFIALWLILPNAHAVTLLNEGFGANNLVGTFQGDTLREFTPNFELLREIPLPQELAESDSPCLLPKGNVLLNTPEGVAMVDPAGNLVREIDLGGKPTGRTLGPNGQAFAVVRTAIYEVNVYTGDKRAIAQLPSIAGGDAPCFLPNGLLTVRQAAPPGDPIPFTTRRTRHTFG